MGKKYFSPCALLISAGRRKTTLDILSNWIMGLSVAVQPYNIMIAIVGLILGIIVGVLPGLGGANGVAILIPITFATNIVNERSGYYIQFL